MAELLRTLATDRRLQISLLLWAIAAALVVWALRTVPLDDLLDVLGGLHAGQVGLLLLANAAVFLSLALRWWIILRAQGHRVPLLKLAAYRLAGFGVSYFTPGPHVGGEPVQVYLLAKRGGVPGVAATASVGLDRLIDLTVNAAVVVAAALIVLRGQVFGGRSDGATLAVALVLLFGPAIPLFAIAAGRRPFAWLIERLPERLLRSERAQKIGALVETSEREMIRFWREQPAAAVGVLLVSALTWALLLAELWLALVVLGVEVTLLQFTGVLVALRATYLAPSPGGLGVLEAGQVLAFRTMELDPAAGLSLSVLIRARDVLTGGLGLWWGGTRLNGLLVRQEKYERVDS